MFYDKYYDLCQRKGVSPSRAADEMGINRSNVSAWKKNGFTPQGEALQKIADYFGVSTDYLLGNESNEKTLDEQLDGVEFALLDGARGLTDEGKKAVLTYIKFLEQQEKEGK